MPILSVQSLSEKAKSSARLLRQGKPSAGCGLCILFRRTGTFSSYMDNPQKASDDGYRQHGEPPDSAGQGPGNVLARFLRKRVASFFRSTFL
jgi:hypothetical protein